MRGAGAGAGSELAPPREKSRVFRVRGVFVCGELRLRIRIGTTAKACDSEAEERAAALSELGSVDWGDTYLVFVCELGLHRGLFI